MNVINMDCIEGMRMFPDGHFDSIVTDPPYELGFMGKSWDASGIAYSVEMWREALRVLKPGGHLLAFSGSRTYHRMVCAIEDAGFEVRDQIMWVYGSGFPKSLDVSKAIDAARDDRTEILRVTVFVADAAERAGMSRAAVDEAMGTSDMAGWWLSRLQHRCQCPKWDQWLQLKVLLSFGDAMDTEVWRLNGRKGTPGNERDDREVSTPASNEIFQPTQRVINAGTPVLDAAKQWDGWGTALKPAHEPICVARKPLIGTVAANVLEHGTGALNIDGCRVGDTDCPSCGHAWALHLNTVACSAKVGKHVDGARFPGAPIRCLCEQMPPVGRWPANLIHDGSDEVLAAFPEAPGQLAKASTSDTQRAGQNVYGDMARGSGGAEPRADAGSAARFFYAAKCSQKDRNQGCEGVTTWENADLRSVLVAVQQLQKATSDISTLLQAGSEWSTTLFGSEPTAQYLPAIKSIIETIAKQTTDSTTLNYSARSSISGCIQVATATATASGSSLASFAESTNPSRLNTTCEKTASTAGVVHAALLTLSNASAHAKQGNIHSTVKPTDLMRYLCRLVTPPGGLVLDPFTGSGSTGKAAVLEGFAFLGFELSAEYAAIAQARIDAALSVRIGGAS